MENLGRAQIVRKTGAEPFHAAGVPLGFDVRSFWQWSASDLVSNATRGLVAEYLVAEALGLAANVRTEWDSCDVRTPGGLKVEVKSAGYLQSWAQRTPSAINYDIARKRAWDAATNSSAPEPCRVADVYVFALHAHREKATLDPLNVTQWQFFILPTRILEERCPGQKRISLGALLALGAERVAYADLDASLRAATGGTLCSAERNDEQR